MRTLCTSVLCILTGILPALAGPMFTMRVETERTASSMSYDTYATHPRMSSMSHSTVRYIFHIRASALAPAQALVEWVVLNEGVDGEPHESSRGQATAYFPKHARRAEIRAEPITLSNAPGTTFGEGIYGYGIRLTDDKGVVLGEKYAPARARDRITWSTAAAAASPPPEPTRPTVPMPMVF